ncbi:MAG: plasmid segregation centromere-binding protein ParR [Stigonema ocellatum SAG 48.90 = DSM 106950]|nr:plasmid segregation centromere-binding protein ParR [Stigonema ocellatum SAG 48.90 = DSM 106950]
MFQWSKKVVKSVTFDPGVADESLLGLVESHLEKEPEKTFSDLCKEALWQHLCVPESVRPSPKTAATPKVEQQIAELQSQLADLEERFFAQESNRLSDLEERFFAQESNRLEIMEHHLMQLSQQVAQLAIMVNQVLSFQSPTLSTSAQEVVNTTPTSPNAAIPSQEVDPVISRISQFLDDF